MKRLAFLLALPYVVTVSTYSKTDHIYQIEGIMLCTDRNKDMCYDMAEVLSEAHKRRKIVHEKPNIQYHIRLVPPPPEDGCSDRGESAGDPINIYKRDGGIICPQGNTEAECQNLFKDGDSDRGKVPE